METPSPSSTVEELQAVLEAQETIAAAYWGEKKLVEPASFYQTLSDLYAVDPFLLHTVMDREVGTLLHQYSTEADDLFLAASKGFLDQQYQHFVDALLPEFSRAGLSKEKYSELITQAIPAIGAHIARYQAHLESNTELQQAFGQPEFLEHRIATMIKYGIWKQFMDFAFSIEQRLG